MLAFGVIHVDSGVFGGRSSLAEKKMADIRLVLPYNKMRLEIDRKDYYVSILIESFHTNVSTH